MRSIDSNQMLDTLEARVNAHLQEAVAVYQNLNSSVLLSPAPDGGWSVAQCLEHLNRYGHYYLPLISSGLQQHGGGPGRIFRSTRIGAYFTKMMDPDSSRKKYRAFREYMPPVTLDGHAVVAEFIRQQELLLNCLRQARNADMNKIRIPVSIMKWLRLKLGDVFQFIIAHNERHLRQAKRAYAAAVPV